MMRALAALALLLAGACSAGASGGPVSGEALFNRCAGCHNARQGGGNGVGPNLYGVVGRKAASLPDFRYSPALSASGFTWDEATLDRFLSGPQRAVPGTKMTFAGLPKAEQRRAVIDYLKRQGAARR